MLGDGAAPLRTLEMISAANMIAQIANLYVKLVPSLAIIFIKANLSS
jgi:hypothetical protein